MKNLKDFLEGNAFSYDPEYNYLYLDHDMFSPGYLCTLAAFLKSKNISNQNFDAPSSIMSYLKTLGFHKTLWGVEDNINRCNSGKSYSPLTPLVAPAEVDIANTLINSCIRHLVNNKKTQGIADLCKVVGELHDNVWSHGKSTGFSMAQRTSVPNTQRLDNFIEFALADSGLGFLEELTRAKIVVENHEHAIKWCIEEGNSSKLVSHDTWRQRLPDDLLGNDPMMGFGSEISENNHQGLGLAHLIKLIKNYQGELILCTGDTLFSIDPEGNESYIRINNEWKGVSISCKLKESKLIKTTDTSLDDPQRQHIIERLRGIKS